MTVVKRWGPTNARKTVTVEGGAPEPGHGAAGQARPREEPSTFAPGGASLLVFFPHHPSSAGPFRRRAVASSPRLPLTSVPLPGGAASHT